MSEIERTEELELIELGDVSEETKGGGTFCLDSSTLPPNDKKPQSQC